MPKKCLVVDDNAETIEIVTYILAKAGMEVLSAYDGQQGLERARASLPDLILLDLMMPVMDGYTMFEHLRKDPSTHAIPVIIISARSGMEVMFENGWTKAVQGYLVKPFSPKELLQKITEVLGELKS